MAAEYLHQGVIIPLDNYSIQAYKRLKKALKSVPGFQDGLEELEDREKANEVEKKARHLLSHPESLGVHMILKKEVVGAEELGIRRSPEADFSIGGLEKFLQGRFRIAPWPAELPTAPASIRQSRTEAEMGTGALVVARDERMISVREDMEIAIEEYFGFEKRPPRLFNPEVEPAVQLAYARLPEDLAYLEELRDMINKPGQRTQPAHLEPGEQLVIN